MPRKLTPAQEELLIQVARAELKGHPLETFGKPEDPVWYPSVAWRTSEINRVIKQLQKKGTYFERRPVVTTPTGAWFLCHLFVHSSIRSEFHHKAALAMLREKAVAPQAAEVKACENRLYESKAKWRTFAARAEEFPPPDNVQVNAVYFLKEIERDGRAVVAAHQELDKAKLAFQPSSDEITAFLVAHQIEGR